jgi:hypothetical protein
MKATITTMPRQSLRIRNERAEASLHLLLLCSFLVESMPTRASFNLVFAHAQRASCTTTPSQWIWQRYNTISRPYICECDGTSCWKEHKGNSHSRLVLLANEL